MHFNMNTSRRDFLKNTGCLAIAFSLPTATAFSETTPLLEELPRSLQGQPNINAWLEVLADGRVRVFTGKVELGQGIQTAIAQVAAEELDLSMDRVEVVIAETGRTPNEGTTAGSGSIEGSAMAVRYAAAAARQKLLELAAKKLNVPVAQLQISAGKIGTASGLARLSFSELLEDQQITDEVRLPVVLKPKEKYKLVGKAIPRDDIGRMARAQSVYVQDLRFPNMVHARVVRPPAYRTKLLQWDENALKKQFPELLKTVINGSFVGVIAEDEFQAIQAQQFLRTHTQWEASKPLPSDKPLKDYLLSLPVNSRNVSKKGTVEALNVANAQTLKAEYFKPYIMHGSIGPSCAVALYESEILHVWTHSQGVYPLRETLQKLLRIPLERIHVKGVPGSGCYGHNGADDVATDAALLAMAYPDKHVRLQWSREEEHAWEPYGSAMVMKTEARLNENGKISHWRYALWSDSHSTRPGGNPSNLLAARYLSSPVSQRGGGYSGGAYRNSEPYYAIPNQQTDAHFFEGSLRTSALRGLGAYANIFAIESFMDELAEKAKKDPFEFRLAHLDDVRAKEVLQKLREITKDQKITASSGMGIAFSRYKNSATYCAVAALVNVDKVKKTVQVKKMWAVIDSGEVINLDGIKNQTEGGMIQSASWTLKEQVRFDAQHVSSVNWDSYPIFRFSDVPEVEVIVIDRPNEPVLGAGEAAQGPAAAAIANAVYWASGIRVRQLPVQIG